MFSEMTALEMDLVNGGGAKSAAAVGFGTVLASWAPAAAFIPGVGPAAAIAMGLTGAGLIGKGTGKY